VLWPPLCGIILLLVLVCLGLCLEELSTCLHIGGSLEGRGELRFGRGFGEFHGGYFSFVFSYAISLDGDFFVPTVD